MDMNVVLYMCSPQQDEVSTYAKHAHEIGRGELRALPGNACGDPL